MAHLALNGDDAWGRRRVVDAWPCPGATGVEGSGLSCAEAPLVAPSDSMPRANGREKKGESSNCSLVPPWLSDFQDSGRRYSF